MKTIGSIAVALLIAGCAPDIIPSAPTPHDANPILVRDVAPPPDYRFIDANPALADRPDMLPAVDPCEDVTVEDHEEYCRCIPECCSTQEWFCPPQPDNAIQSMQVTIEMCNDDGETCEFGVDEDCPPPRILHRSDCQIAHECPPGSSRDFLRWFECQLEDGRMGRQRVLCDKGVIIHGPCTSCDPEVCDGIDNDCDNLTDEDPVICEDACGPGVGLCQDGVLVDCVNREPAEDVCNFIDDDCDGEIDEGQRNACDLCGELPAEDCDGQDNDCDDHTDEALIRECETACDRGLETCLGGRWASCTARQPANEVCDGFDNDCDGLSDENLTCLCTREQVGALFPCAEEPLLCGLGFKTCECLDVDCELLQLGQCKALCSHLPPVAGVECDPRIGRPAATEVCNNFDEDCDDLVDEGLSQACYSGPRDTLNVGICLPGDQSCVAGQWGAPDATGAWAPHLCEGEVIPAPEICNGADDDCDGEVDYGEEMRPTDILLILDTSGSMEREIQAVTTALARFGQHFAAEDLLHWGLIIGPTRRVGEEGGWDEILTLVANITPFQQFFAGFNSLDPRDFTGGLEMHSDAVMLALRNLSPLHVNLAARAWVRGVFSIPPIDQFIIDWRPATERIIIVFTDEDEQSYMNPTFHPDDVAAALRAAPNTKLFTFAQAFYGWDEQAIATGGRNFNLSPHSGAMYNSLMSILEEICLPREEAAAMIPIAPSYIPASYNFRMEMMCY